MLDSIKNNLAWRAVPFAGLVGGTAFLLTILGLSSLWLGVNGSVLVTYFASLLMGQDVLIDQGIGVLVVGVIVHYVLSLVFALIIAIVVHRWGLMVGILGGAILGLSLYGINLYTMTVWFPWFYAINSSLLLVGHVIYGAVTGGVYELLDHYDPPQEERQVPHAT